MEMNIDIIRDGEGRYKVASPILNFCDFSNVTIVVRLFVREPTKPRSKKQGRKNS